jgi:hypothetical protein
MERASRVFLQAKGHSVVEVNRPNRQLRHQNGKSDSLDAENAARAVLGGQANARPKSADSSVEMIQHLKVPRDTAVKSRTQAMITLCDREQWLEQPVAKLLDFGSRRQERLTGPAS